MDIGEAQGGDEFLVVREHGHLGLGAHVDDDLAAPLLELREGGWAGLGADVGPLPVALGAEIVPLGEARGLGLRLGDGPRGLAGGEEREGARQAEDQGDSLHGPEDTG